MARELTEQERAFVAEYRALCEKHGMALFFDGGYQAGEVGSLTPDFDWEDYMFRPVER